MAQDVPFSIDPDNPIAVYVQIENQIKFGIVSGLFPPGHALPSVREMSQRLQINPNTVTKAYRDLELQGVVVTRRGVGVSITNNALRVCKAETLQMVREHLQDAVAECVAVGMSGADIRKLVKETLENDPPPYARR